jgi:hypothetical protein
MLEDPEETVPVSGKDDEDARERERNKLRKEKKN